MRSRDSVFGLSGVLVAALLLPVSGFADSHDDVAAVIDVYLETETNLAEQAKLMTDDRTFIIEGKRHTDNVANMAGQMAQEKLFAALDPEATLILTAEDPLIKVYGDTAVASFYRHWTLIPGVDAVIAGHAGEPPPSQVVTLVLNKSRGDWKIVHTHSSPMGGN